MALVSFLSRAPEFIDSLSVPSVARGADSGDRHRLIKSNRPILPPGTEVVVTLASSNRLGKEGWGGGGGGGEVT